MGIFLANAPADGLDAFGLRDRSVESDDQHAVDDAAVVLAVAGRDDGPTVGQLYAGACTS